MKIRDLVRRVAPLFASLLMSACGGGGGGGGGGDDGGNPVDGIPAAPTTPISLSTKAHVQREVGNTIDVYAAFFNIEPGEAAALARRMEMAEPKAAVTTPCLLGGSRTTDEGSGAHDFAYFDVSNTVAFYTEKNDACVEDDGDGDPTFTTFEGYFEEGSTALDPDGNSYAYELFGTDDTRYSELERDRSAPDDFFFRSPSGQIEYFLTLTGTETRSVTETRFEELRGTARTAGTIIQGQAGDPFVVRFVFADETLTFDGPYRYATRTCSGGQGRIETLAALTLDESRYPNGGQIELSNGTDAVQVTFNLDGSASYQFVGGASGTLTREEIVASPGIC